MLPRWVGVADAGVWHAVRFKNKCTLRRRVIFYTTTSIIIRRRVLFIQELGLGLGLGARILLTFLHYTSEYYYTPSCIIITRRRITKYF